MNNDKIQKRLNYLNFLFGHPEEFNINKTNIDLLYLKIPEWCCTYSPQPLLDGIGPFEWNKMTTTIIKIYDSKNEPNSSFFNSIEEYEMKTLDVPIDDILMNCMMLNYIKCRPNVKILTQFSSNKVNFDNYYVYATKKIELSRKAVECAIYQLYCLTDKFKSYDEIKSYVDSFDSINIDTYTVTITVYEIKSAKTDNIKLSIDPSTDIISRNFIESITHSEIFFNKNSLEFLNEMLLERFLSKEFDRSRFLINTYKKVLMVRKLSLLEQSKFLLLAGTVLAAYGIRKGTDLDFFISNLPASIDDTTIAKISDLFMNENKKLFFFDGYHPKVRWSDFWTDWHKEWASLFGANSMLECVHNPKYHFYFCGVKMIILQAEIERRNHRGRAAAIADLIMINRLLHKNIIFKPIAKEYNKYNEIKKVDPKEFINIVKYWLKKKFNTKITQEELDQIIFIE
jgi:hypothetical protein